VCTDQSGKPLQDLPDLASKTIYRLATTTTGRELANGPISGTGIAPVKTRVCKEELSVFISVWKRTVRPHQQSRVCVSGVNIS